MEEKEERKVLSPEDAERLRKELCAIRDKAGKCLEMLEEEKKEERKGNGMKRVLLILPLLFTLFLIWRILVLLL